MFENRKFVNAFFVLNDTSTHSFVTNKSQSLKERRLMKETFPIKKVVMLMIKQFAGLKSQEVKLMNNNTCPDCDTCISISGDTEKGEILSCPSCGLELEVMEIKDGCVDLQELTIEGEDWGE